MNIGATIRVLHAEPVGDPRPGEWPAVPTEAEAGEAGARDGARPDVTAAEPATTPDPDATTVVPGPSRE